MLLWLLTEITGFSDSLSLLLLLLLPLRLIGSEKLLPPSVLFLNNMSLLLLSCSKFHTTKTSLIPSAAIRPPSIRGDGIPITPSEPWPRITLSLKVEPESLLALKSTLSPSFHMMYMPSWPVLPTPPLTFAMCAYTEHTEPEWYK